MKIPARPSVKRSILDILFRTGDSSFEIPLKLVEKMTQERPKVTVGALIFNNQGEILIGRSHKWHDKYVIPGGHIEAGETTEEAVKREVKEETNLDVEDVKFVQMQESIFSEHYYLKKHFIFLDFACKAKNDDVKMNEEFQDFVWVTPEKALGMDTEPFTISLIQAYLKK